MIKFSFARTLSLVFSVILITGCLGKKDQKKDDTPEIINSNPGYSLTITSPSNPQYSSLGKIDIKGTYSVESDSAGTGNIEIKIQDTSANELTSNSFEFKNIPLKFGKNNIKVKLYKNGEVKADANVTVIYSDFFIEITSPLDGQVFRKGQTDILGSFQYPEGTNMKDVRILIDSRLEAQINSNGTFEYKNYSLKKGTHDVSAAIVYKTKGKDNEKYEEKYKDTKIIKFYEKNETPDAKLKITPSEGKSPLSVTLNGSESSDVDGKILKYYYNFGDGQFLESTTPIVQHTYKYILRNCKIDDTDDDRDDHGDDHKKLKDNEDDDHYIKIFKAELTVVDNDNVVSKPAKQEVKVKCQKNSPPVVGANQTISGFEDQVLSFNLNQATDVDGDPLTYILVSAPPVGTLINCLDGLPGLQCTYIPKPNYFGPITFSYKVNDGIYDSEIATVTLNLAPVNDPPEMVGAQNFSTNEDTPFYITLSGATDVDGDILKYRIVLAPMNGKLENCLASTGNLICRFTPDKDFNGTISFSYIANDGQVDAGTASVVTINVIPVNDPPVMLGDQTFNGTEDNNLIFSLSGATDVENDNLTYSLVTPPQNGQLQNCLGGTNKLNCSFVPNKDFNGVITFTYKANDGKADSITVSTVTINFAPVNDAPVLIADQSFQVNEDTSLNFNINGATDVDGDNLIYKLIVSPNVGTISGCLNGTSSKTCMYTPPKDFNGTVTLTYLGNDGQLDTAGTSKIKIEVLPVNDPPVVGADQVLATSEDVPFNFSLNVGTDVEGDVLKYKIVTQPSSGQIIGCLDNTTSLNCTYVPAKDFNGTVTLTYKINDGSADSETLGKLTINIAPVNDAPVVGADQTFIGQEDAVLNFKISSATDVDGDPLTYKIVNAPTNGTLQGCLQNTASVDCTFIPDKDFNGTVEFTYKANDGILDSESAAKVTLKIQPVNDPPVMREDQTIGLFEDQMIVIVLSGASDVDSNNLTYSLVKAPVGGTLSGCLDNTGSLICTFTPDLNFNGKIEFTYKANDGALDSTTVSTVTLNVWPVNDPPIMGADQSFTMNENTSLSFTVNKAFDVEGDPLTYKVILPPSSGTLSGCMNNDQNLTCTYTPVPNFSGDIVIRYRANDGQDSTTKLGTINIKVLMVNVAPVMASNITFETNEDEGIDFIVPVATDADNDPLTYKIITHPSTGVLSGCLDNNSNLNCHYTPPENFNGLVSFTYKANDGRLDAENLTEVTIKVKPVNDIPYVGKSQSLSLNENSHLDFSLSKGGDLEGDELRYKIVSGPTNGTIAGCLDNTTSIDCSYTPNTDFKGIDSLTYIVNDGISDSITTATVSFMVVEINRAPVIAQSLNVETDEDVPLQITLPVATDANGDSLTYWLAQAPTNGKIENCLGGTTNLLCQFTPDKDFNGIVTFSYFAFDGKLQSSKLLVAINVNPVNDPPVMGLDQEFKFNEDQSIFFDLNKATDVDTDSNLIFYSIVSPPPKGVLSNCLNFTNDLHCDYTPEANYNGEVEFTYTASDGIAFSLEVAKVKLNILPANDKPYFEKPQLAEVNANETTSLNINPAMDVDGDNLTYKIVQGPTNATIQNCMDGTNDLTCDFIPNTDFNGEVTFKIRAFDGKEYSDEQKVSVSVLVPPVYPKMIASKGFHTCVLLSNGEVTCWGVNSLGQLGLGNTQNIGDNELPASSPKVSLGEKAKFVAVGMNHSCAILVSGNLKCWGYNSSGQLGLGDTQNIGDNELPSSVSVINLGEKVVEVAAGTGHTCAILESGNLKCWGANGFGQLGMGNTAVTYSPPSTPVSLGGVKVKQIVAGDSHTCALLDDGSVKCWGLNGNTYQSCYSSCWLAGWWGSGGCSTYCSTATNALGPLGIGRIDIIGDNEVPSSVENVDIGEKVIKLAASMNNTCAILESGNLKCWGQNLFGQLGLGNTQTIGDNEVPSSVSVINIGAKVVDVSVGSFHVCASFEDNTSKCWGYNAYGQLGLGNNQSIGDNELPNSISVLSLGDGVEQMSSGQIHNCFILKNKQIKCWGYNREGELGLGNTQNIGINELPSSVGNVVLTGNFPVANFEFNPSKPYENINIVFNGMASTSSEVGGYITKYQWDFGDGLTAEGAVASHQYNKAGTYEVRLLITDDKGISNVNRKNILIVPEPKPTPVIATSAITGFASFKVDFSGANSTASEIGESIISYEWDFGDGSAPIGNNHVMVVGKNAFASGMNISHIYVTPGVYSARLTVTDSKNRKSFSSRMITVLDSLPPVSNFIYSSLQGKRAPVDVSFDATSSTPGSFDGSIVSYAWDFGDGSVENTAVVNHKFTTVGIYKVLLTVTDDRGKIGTKEVSLDVPAELQPKAQIVASAISGHRPLNITLDGSSSYPANPDGQIIKYEWDFGDGEVASGQIVNHVFNQQGIYEVKLNVIDDIGKTSSTTISIDVQPSSPPVANFNAIADSTYSNVPIGVKFDASSSNGGTGGATVTSYDWNFGDGASGVGKIVNHIYKMPGTFEITLKVTNSDGEYSIKKLSKTYIDALSINISASQEAQFVYTGINFTAITHDGEAKIINDPVTWISSDPSILQFYNNGQANAVKPGSVFVTAKIGNNSSQPLKIEVKKFTDIPQLLVANDYFLKSFEEALKGGVNGYSVSSDYSPLSYAPVEYGLFSLPIALPSGERSIEIKGSTVTNTLQKTLRFFDGHGNSLFFDGKDDVAQMAMDSSLLGGQSFSFGFWVRLGEVSLAGDILNLQDDQDKGIKIYFDYKKSLVVRLETNQSPIFVFGGILPTNEWNHLLVNYDANTSTLNFYQNGRLVSQRYTTWTFPWKGKRLVGTLGGDRFFGLIDELNFFDQSLTDQQIKNLMFDKVITGVIPKAIFSFEGTPKQEYNSGNSTITLGTSVGYDSEDPKLRFASQVIASKILTPNEGGVLSLRKRFVSESTSQNRISFELAPFVLTENVNTTLELLDAKTPGFLPDGISDTEYLIRLFPISAAPLNKPGNLTLPMQSEKYRKNGTINLFRYVKSSGAIYRKTPVHIDLNEQMVTFPIKEFGTYFSSYDTSFLPQVEYYGNNISDIPFNFDYDRRLVAKFKGIGTGPFNVQIDGNLDGAEIYTGCYNSGGKKEFPLSFTGLSLGHNFCELNLKKKVDETTILYLKHLIDINIEN